MVWLTQCTVAEYHPCISTLMTLDCLLWRKISYNLTSGKQISRNFWSASLKRSHKSLSSKSEPDSGSFCFFVPHHPSGVKFFRSQTLPAQPHSSLSISDPFLLHGYILFLSSLFLFKGFLLSVWGRWMPIHELYYTILTRSANSSLSPISCSQKMKVRFENC